MSRCWSRSAKLMLNNRRWSGSLYMHRSLMYRSLMYRSLMHRSLMNLYWCSNCMRMWSLNSFNDWCWSDSFYNRSRS